VTTTIGTIEKQMINYIIYRFLANIVRFATHFALFVYDYYDIKESTDVKDGIIVKYIHYLTETKQYDHVPFYTSQITSLDIRILTYAKFLGAVIEKEPDMDMESIKRYTDAALEYNLDVNAITKKLVTEKLHQGSLAPPHISPDKLLSEKGIVEMKDNTISPKERQEIYVLRWLCIYPSQYLEAIVQSNLLIRQFIKLGKIKATTMILSEILPSGVTLEVQDREHEALKVHGIWKTYIAAHEKYAAWIGHISRKPKQPTADMIAGDSTYSAQLEYERAKRTYHVLTNEWVKNESGLRADASTTLHYLLELPWSLVGYELRSKCIPEIVFMLYYLMFNSNDYKGALNLANVVAASNKQLYTSFTGAEMKLFLIALKEAQLREMTE
jgi:hypothetical protein